MTRRCMYMSYYNNAADFEGNGARRIGNQRTYEELVYHMFAKTEALAE